jgi:hypothetical protein
MKSVLSTPELSSSFKALLIGLGMGLQGRAPATRVQGQGAHHQHHAQKVLLILLFDKKCKSWLLTEV